MENKYIISRFRKSHLLKLLKEVLSEETTQSKSGKKFSLIQGYSYDKVCDSISVVKEPKLVDSTSVSLKTYVWSVKFKDQICSRVLFRVFTEGEFKGKAIIGNYGDAQELTQEYVDEWIKEVIRQSPMLKSNIKW